MHPSKSTGIFHILTAIIELLLISTVFGAITKYKHRDGEVYDFIVVGGGTAGCVIGSRLSENDNVNVLVLERGGIPSPWLDVPAISSHYWNDDNVKYYNSLPQNTQGIGDNRVIRYITGRTLGGSSQLNGMLFMRGSPYDYDNWAKISEDGSWSYQNMLKYFKKMENYSGDFPSDQHGYGGPISVSRPRYAPGLSQYKQGAKFLGYPYADPNGPQRISYTPTEYSKKKGRRVSSYTGYIKPIMASRQNLEIVTNAEVKRILFEGDKAIGVRYTSEGLSHPVEVRARKEIIVSAGTLNSPAILMRSGIGPKEVLESAGISPVVADLPVGYNLQDHVGIKLDFLLNDTLLSLVPERDLNERNFMQFNKYGVGPYSSAYGTGAAAFLTSSTSEKNGIGNWPDLQFQTVHATNYPGPPDWNEFRSLYTSHLDNISQTVVTVWSMLTRAKSVGRLTLNTTNIDEDPLIDFQYLSHPDDQSSAVELIKHVIQLYEGTPGFQRVDAHVPPVSYPKCEDFKFRSDEYWSCFVRYTAVTGLHAAGTCRMGKGAEDLQAVLDSKLRVIGVKGLSVADASIMPDVTNSNTQAPVYGIAEKAADMIKERWGI